MVPMLPMSFTYSSKRPVCFKSTCDNSELSCLKHGLKRTENGLAKSKRTDKNGTEKKRRVQLENGSKWLKPAAALAGIAEATEQAVVKIPVRSRSSCIHIDGVVFVLSALFRHICPEPVLAK